jgi:hypothetical protein
MPSLTHLPDRHVVIDRRPGRYLSFPDVALAPSGSLVTVYREADEHVAEERAMLLCRRSTDGGRTWSEAETLHAGHGHCPRLTRLPDGELVAIDDATRALYRGGPDGERFTMAPYAGPPIPLPDRLLALGPERWLTAGHSHRGSFRHPTTRQPTSEELTFLSTDQGRSFHALSIMAYDPFLVLCEASMTALADGRILALLRENSFVYEPMYAVISQDGGETWSLPRPTPLIGHRPTLGRTASGALLVTYRNVGPDMGTAAWLGSVDELLADFAVAGRAPCPEDVALTDEGLVIDNPAGTVHGARFALRPLTYPERATARLAATVRVDAAEGQACGIRFGGLWWRLFPDRLEVPGRAPIGWEAGRFHDIGLTYTRGTVTLAIDGTRRARLRVDARAADTRPILFGTPSIDEDNAGRHLWRAVSLTTREPRYERRYRWQWHFRDGLPDATSRARVLELDNDRQAAFGDFGYSGWTELPDSRFFCVYHHGGGSESGYERGRSSHIKGVWFTEHDFRAR